MKLIVMAVVVVFGCAVVCWSQAYYEASGQSAVFTLTAGARSGPAPAAIRSGSVVPTGLNNGISVVVASGNIVIKLSAMLRGYADIALYDIKGRQMYLKRGYRGTSLRLDRRTFAPGIYNMLVRFEGKYYSRRIAVNGRGE